MKIRRVGAELFHVNNKAIKWGKTYEVMNSCKSVVSVRLYVP